jgi:hypothetical protein
MKPGCPQSTGPTGQSRHGARIALVAKTQRGAPVWQVLAQNELASRERRRELIARARASAENVTREDGTFKLVKLPPELGIAGKRAHR